MSIATLTPLFQTTLHLRSLYVIYLVGLTLCKRTATLVAHGSHKPIGIDIIVRVNT